MADEGACDNYQIDMTAASFGQCKCGFPKAAHKGGPVRPATAVQRPLEAAPASRGQPPKPTTAASPSATPEKPPAVASASNPAVAATPPPVPEKPPPAAAPPKPAAESAVPPSQPVVPKLALSKSESSNSSSDLVSPFETPREVERDSVQQPAPGRDTLADYNTAAVARLRSFGEQSTVSVPSSTSGASSAGTASDSKASAELAEMRRKLGMFMLGGDMSGGNAGTHAALTLSNAITNLSVGCWSGVTELGPVPATNLVKWRQQVRWYTAPLEQIIVKQEGLKTLADGSQVEVSGLPTQPRKPSTITPSCCTARPSLGLPSAFPPLASPLPRPCLALPSPSL